MSETGRIWDLLQRSFEGGDAWKCPSLRDLLASVTAAQAAARPIPGAPTIWELLLHATVQEELVRRRLSGEVVDTLPDELAWPKPGDVSPAAWLQAKLDFGEARRALRQAVADFEDARLSEPVPGRDYPCYVMLYGVIEHLQYHAGQIEMLMLAQGVRPAASPMASVEKAIRA
jgi:uncharacterized damage-inducible protein DinB